MVVVRKDLDVIEGQLLLQKDVRFFFYITNLRDLTAAEIVHKANDRCEQENLIDHVEVLPGARSPTGWSCSGRTST